MRAELSSERPSTAEASASRPVPRSQFADSLAQAPESKSPESKGPQSAEQSSRGISSGAVAAGAAAVAAAGTAAVAGVAAADSTDALTAAAVPEDSSADAAPLAEVPPPAEASTAGGNSNWKATPESAAPAAELPAPLPADVPVADSPPTVVQVPGYKAWVDPLQRSPVFGQLEALFQSRIAFIDGAMGTSIQKYKCGPHPSTRPTREQLFFSG